MPTQFTKPGLYMTRNGTKAEILAVRGEQTFGLIYYPNDIRIACSWHFNGSIFPGSVLPSDIVGQWQEVSAREQESESLETV